MIPQDIYKISRYSGNNTDGIDHLGRGGAKELGRYTVDGVFRDLNKIGVIRMDDFTILHDYKITVENTTWAGRDYYISFGGDRERMTSSPSVVKYALYLKP